MSEKQGVKGVKKLNKRIDRGRETRGLRALVGEPKFLFCLKNR